MINMEYEIVDVVEKKGQLRVYVESEYGLENFGLSLKAKYLGSDGKPRWTKEVDDFMNKKYGCANKDKSLPEKKLFQEYVGKKIVIGGTK